MGDAVDLIDFAAIDVETANPAISSICQIGIALFREGKCIHEWKTYIDPQDYFSELNIAIHGITDEKVKGAPVLSDVADQICRYLDKRITICHTHFDRVAIEESFSEYGCEPPNCIWLDSARVARRTWKQFALSGYGLENICKFLGYEFAHHDALEDAKAAAFILHAAIKETQLDLKGWLKQVNQPIDPSKASSGKYINREGNLEGPLFGEILVFTGSLEVNRAEAADIAARLGCKVESGVTKRTTLLVVGDQDIQALAGHEKSSKHRKAEDLISKGQSIRILRETDFKLMVNKFDSLIAN